MKTLNIERLKETVKKKERQPNGNFKESYRKSLRKLKILKRDNFKCVECGTEKNLTIHHPNGRKFAKSDNAQKYKLDKCVTLCEKCHIAFHKNEFNNEMSKMQKQTYEE